MGQLVLCKQDDGYVYATSDRQVISAPFKAKSKPDFERALTEFRNTLHPVDRAIPLSEESERFIARTGRR